MTSLTYRQFVAFVTCLIIVSGFLLFKTNTSTNSERNHLASLLTIYTAYDQQGPLQLIRLGRANDGGYVVPVKALEESDLLMGYGIANDPSFEIAFSDTFHKPAFGFDCGVSHPENNHNLFTFINECIGNDKFLYLNQTSSQRISSYTQQIQRLHLEDKNIFIKMDIEGAEYRAFPDILHQSAHITGVVLEIHVDHNTFPQAIQLLSDLSQHFLLLHVHGNNYSQAYFSSNNASGCIPQVLELTYINKSLVTNYKIADNQSHPLPIDMPNNVKQEDVVFRIL